MVTTIVEMAVIINMNEKDIIVLIIFLVVLLILNIIFCFLKLLDINKLKYIYWYLFIISWIVAFFRLGRVVVT